LPSPSEVSETRVFTMSEKFCIIERSGRAGGLSADNVGNGVAMAKAWLASAALVCAGWSAVTGRDLGNGIPGEAEASTGALVAMAGAAGSLAAIAGRKSAGIHRSASASRAVENCCSAFARIERFNGCKAAPSAGPRTKRSSKVTRSAFPGSAAEASVGTSPPVIHAAIISDKPIAAKANRMVLRRPERRTGGLRTSKGLCAGRRAGEALRAIATGAAIESPMSPRRGRNQNPPRIKQAIAVR
jgi:hypothetical protein